MLNSLLTQMLEQQAAPFLKATCDIDRKNPVYGDYGQSERTRQRIASNVPCRVIRAGSANNAAVEAIAARESASEVYWCVLPHGRVALTTDDFITVEGVEYAVVRIESALTDALFDKALIVRR